MSKKPVDLKALQKLWYEKLKLTGFVDIEDTSSPREYLKTWHSSYFIHRHTPESFQSTQDYYRRASQFLYEYPYFKRMEKKVWALHTDGISMREIAERLDLLLSDGKGSKSVYTIIHKLELTMNEWEFDQG